MAMTTPIIRRAGRHCRLSAFATLHGLLSLTIIIGFLIGHPETAFAQTCPTAPSSAKLGEDLFNSPALSSDGIVACSSCHVARFGYSGDRPKAAGVEGHLGNRRAPSLVNLNTQSHFGWAGTASTLEEQILLPLESSEMKVNWPTALAALNSGTPPLADMPMQHSLTRCDTVAALAEYVRTLRSGPSRFDRFYFAGDQTALTDQERLGFRLFIRKAGCSSCHLLNGGAAPLTDGSFHSIGIGNDEAPFIDIGRANVSGRKEDVGLFKTPTLRDVSLRPYLMHDGSMTSLHAVVDYYNRGVPTRPLNVDPRFKPLFLSPDEVDAIVSFLQTLTGMGDPSHRESSGLP